MRWSFGPEFWALAALSAAAAILYGTVFLARPPSVLRALVKTLSAGAAAAAFATAGAFAVTVALIWAAIGDALLSANKKWLLPVAALCFLMTQIGYLGALTPLWIFAGDLSPLWPRYAGMVLIALCVLGTLLWIAPRLRWWALLVLPYSALLTAVCFACMWVDWRGWPVIIGAELWLSSHVLFATAQFRPLPIATAPQGQWWTYVAAHACIVTGAALAAPYMN